MVQRSAHLGWGISHIGKQPIAAFVKNIGRLSACAVLTAASVFGPITGIDASSMTIGGISTNMHPIDILTLYRNKTLVLQGFAPDLQEPLHCEMIEMPHEFNWNSRQSRMQKEFVTPLKPAQQQKKAKEVVAQ